MDLENGSSSLQQNLLSQEQQGEGVERVLESSHQNQQQPFRESLTSEYLRRNRKERQVHYGISLVYIIGLLFFSVVFVFDISGSAESVLGSNSPKNYGFYINQILFYLIQVIQQGIRFRLIRHNYDFFDSRMPKILIISFTSFFFVENLVTLFFLIGNIAHSQMKSEYQEITKYITIPQQVVACIVVLLIQTLVGFYNNLLLVYTLRRRMKNTIVNRILAQSQIRPNEYLALQQYIQSLNIQSQSRFSISSNGEEGQHNISTSDDSASQNQQTSSTHPNQRKNKKIIQSDIASNLVKQKDFIVYGDDPEANERQDFTCSICQLQIQMEDKVIHLQCKHLYHSDCLQLWLVNHHTCPFCRQVV